MQRVSRLAGEMQMIAIEMQMIAIEMQMSGRQVCKQAKCLRKAHFGD